MLISSPYQDNQYVVNNTNFILKSKKYSTENNIAEKFLRFITKLLNLFIILIIHSVLWYARIRTEQTKSSFKIASYRNSKW